MYYAETNYEDWRTGCDRMYTEGTTAHTNCVVQGDQRYVADTTRCQQELDDCNATCERPEKPPRDNCPIVIDLGAHGVRFTSVDAGVSFDIDADGDEDHIAWTDPGEGDGFLVWDRNRNGVIDSGIELFGDATPQAPSAKANGFVALALLDDVATGGNGDGVVADGDRAFGALRVWIDANQNGRSDAGELQSLASLGITAIEYDYRESRRKDRYGNELRYRARVRRDGGFTDAIDVFFRAY